jgi:hypothetical protein
MSKQKKRVGRPSPYKEQYCDQVEKLCKLGATDKDIADFFEVNEDTIYEWKKVHPKFSESIKAGKTLADLTVSDSLFKRATGYEHEEDVIFNDKGVPLIVPTKKRYPPDTTAMIFWLKNRQPEKWRDRKDIDMTSKGESIKPVIIDLTNDDPKLIPDTKAKGGV